MPPLHPQRPSECPAHGKHSDAPCAPVGAYAAAAGDSPASGRLLAAPTRRNHATTGANRGLVPGGRPYGGIAAYALAAGVPASQTGGRPWQCAIPHRRRQFRWSQQFRRPQRPHITTAPQISTAPHIAAAPRPCQKARPRGCTNLRVLTLPMPRRPGRPAPAPAPESRPGSRR